ncbi:hypothetical protein C0J52_18792 [Blattella germanica]|nr:hypothetical protein C0J52_18792 [Blattella germanica]
MDNSAAMSSYVPQCVIEKQKELKQNKKKFKFFQNPSILKSTLNKRGAAKSVYYFTSGTGIDKNSMRDVLKEPSPFCIPPDPTDMCHKLRKKHEEQGEGSHYVSTRPNYLSQKTDLLRRLYVPDDDEERKPELLDIDSEYFKIVEGRPIKEKQDIRTYVEDAKEVLKTRIRVGIHLDEAMEIDEKYLLEQTQIDAIRAKHKLYVNAFDNFLEEDLKTSMKLLREAQVEANKTKEIQIMVHNLQDNLGSLKCAVSVLEEKWRHCKMFQSFLYMISPFYWRKKHDRLYRKKSITELVSVITMPSEVFEKYRSPSVGSEDSLDALVSIFLEDIKEEEKPELYFKSPQQLNRVFEGMELQNLNYLLQLEEMEEPMRSVKSALRDTDIVLGSEILFLQETIKNMKEAIEWEEEKARLLKEKANEMLSDLKELILGKKSLSLHVFVEDAYESCIAPNDSNLGLFDMMQGIELQMEYLLLKLDYLPYDVVKTIEFDTYKEDARIMKDACEAENKLKLMEKLKSRLAKALAPPFKPKPGKRLVSRSEPPASRKKPPKPAKPLTDQEKDYLYFFTEYCRYTDNVSNYFPLKYS